MIHRLTKALLLASLVAASATVSGCIIVSDDDGSSTLEVRNRSSYDFYELYLAPIDSPTFGPNLLGDDPLLPGENIEIFDIDCDTYDVLIVDDLDAECQLLDLDLCFDDAIWTVTDTTLLECDLFGQA